MRRKDREVTKKEDLLDILKQCKVCRVGIIDDEGMYIVPLNFGYTYENDHLVLYVHGAKDGRKYNAIVKNSNVCIEMDCEHQLHDGSTACEYSYRFKSIIGEGHAFIIDNREDKIEALNILMQHQTGKEFTFDEVMVDRVAVIRIEVDHFTGKFHK